MNGVCMDNSRWYVIYTHPKQEDRVVTNLGALDVETLNPKIRKPRCNPFTGAQDYIIRPLYPRYVFARFDLKKMIHKIRFTRGIHNVISLSGSPTVVDQRIIDIIRSRIEQDGVVNVGKKFKHGDELIIKEGPFKNLVGSFEQQMSDPSRIMVLLSTIDYQVHIIVDRDQVINNSNQTRSWI
jgi:transcriptional antiterminator RfaH